MYDKAEAAFRKALSINPHYADAYTNIGLVFFHRGDLNSAVQNWEEALRIHPQSNVAQVYLKLAKGERGSEIGEKKGPRG